MRPDPSREVRGASEFCFQPRRGAFNLPPRSRCAFRSQRGRERGAKRAAFPTSRGGGMTGSLPREAARPRKPCHSGRFEFLTIDNDATLSGPAFLTRGYVVPRPGLGILTKKVVGTDACLDYLTSEIVWTCAAQPLFSSSVPGNRCAPKVNFLPVGNLKKTSPHFVRIVLKLI